MFAPPPHQIGSLEIDDPARAVPEYFLPAPGPSRRRGAPGPVVLPLPSRHARRDFAGGGRRRHRARPSPPDPRHRTPWRARRSAKGWDSTGKCVRVPLLLTPLAFVSTSPRQGMSERYKPRIILMKHSGNWRTSPSGPTPILVLGRPGMVGPLKADRPRGGRKRTSPAETRPPPRISVATACPWAHRLPALVRTPSSSHT